MKLIRKLEAVLGSVSLLPPTATACAPLLPLFHLLHPESVTESSCCVWYKVRRLL